jgi:hypothetical protein
MRLLQSYKTFLLRVPVETSYHMYTSPEFSSVYSFSYLRKEIGSGKLEMPLQRPRSNLKLSIAGYFSLISWIGGYLLAAQNMEMKTAF